MSANTPAMIETEMPFTRAPVTAIDKDVLRRLETECPAIAKYYPQAIGELAEAYWWRKREYRQMLDAGIKPLSMDDPDRWLKDVLPAQARTFGVDVNQMRVEVVITATSYHNWPDDPNYHAAADILRAWEQDKQPITDLIPTLPPAVLEMAVFVAGRWADQSYWNDGATLTKPALFWMDCHRTLREALLRLNASTSTEYVRDMTWAMGLGAA